MFTLSARASVRHSGGATRNVRKLFICLFRFLRHKWKRRCLPFFVCTLGLRPTCSTKGILDIDLFLSAPQKCFAPPWHCTTLKGFLSLSGI
ncbi:hypothetical protein CEXT_164711 [Caerostris extrusa]|uniref:Secreted protein n=1 Tax=Caerostris extrusa TaxID=172846 RepID=A0AAV4T838_CAEEX|nr:hypothetical protein CEXT_164711 [Caerostris extrusa]